MSRRPDPTSITTPKPQPQPSQLLNRELSWLAFNQRVLEESLDPSNPLLERVKFFAITSSNLDEFFEVRVAGLRQQVAGNIVEPTPDGLSPLQALRAVRQRVHELVDRLYRGWRDELVPQLAEHGIRFLRVEELDDADLAWLESFYLDRVHPVLTPLAIDKSHPFPQLINKMLNVVVRLIDTTDGENEEKLGVVQVPPNLPRLVRLPRSDGRQDYIFLGRIIGRFLGRLFFGMEILGHWHIRVTRNGEFYIDTEDAESLLVAIEQELHNRLKGEAVRLEVSHDCPDEVLKVLVERLELSKDDVYRINGPLHPGRIMGIADGVESPELHDPPYVAPIAPVLRGQTDLFAAIRERDILLHHPYESFNTVVDFLHQAGIDDKVLAIKQTLYRTGGDARIIDALIQAARNGKQVTAIVELKARFDEHNNIQWARKLEEAGVHVVYGLLGLKIHAKVALIVRAEPQGIRRYMHLSTGNYNATTAKIYTDIGVLTCRPDFGEDATTLFNLLTGICQFQPMRKFLIAPFELHDRILRLIEEECVNARRGLPARIIAKMNSLVDPQVIAALYAASQDGVQIDLIIRGICCLRPGVPGLSDNIRVRSVVDRFLEHSRVFYFENAANPRVFLGSADWMPRNFFRRIEVVFPIEDGLIRDRIVREILEANLRDNTRARVLQPDGTYTHPSQVQGTGPKRRCQTELLEAATRAAHQDPGLQELPNVGIVATSRPSRKTRVTVRRKSTGA
jgi:polyphosphate kinase